ncbi:restriction endonuclease subunit S [Rhodobacterales bacterium HKCCA1065]|nr:restriction endonuclease subunit S [Rhodobacterales bacterium HKCCA1065]
MKDNGGNQTIHKPLSDVAEVVYGTRVVKKRDEGTKYPVYGGGGATFSVDQTNRCDCMIVARFGMSEECVRFVSGEFFLNDSGLTVKSRDRTLLSQQFLDIQLLGRQPEIFALGRGTAQKNLDVSAFKNLPIAIPPLKEQQQIVAILDEAFEGLARARAHAEANLQNAWELFENARAEIFSGLLDNAAIKSLGEISSRVSVGHVGQTSAHYVDDGGVPFLRSQNVRPTGIDINGVKQITEAFHQKLKKSQLQGGELLFVRVGANRGDCCLMPEDLGETNCANIVFARPTEGDIRYLEHYCQSIAGRSRLLNMTTGSAQGVINTKSVATLPIPLPSMADQEQIKEDLDRLRVNVLTLEKSYHAQLQDLDDLRQSLLQKAFAGELT